jgi:hypothetical protein
MDGWGQKPRIKENMTTKPTDTAKHFIAALSVDGLRRQRRDEILIGHPKATEAEIERLMEADVKRGHLPPASLARAKQILAKMPEIEAPPIAP